MNGNQSNKYTCVKGNVIDKTGEKKEFNYDLGSDFKLSSLIHTMQSFQESVNVYLTQKVEEEKLEKNHQGKREGKTEETDDGNDEDDNDDSNDDNVLPPLEKKKKLDIK